MNNEALEIAKQGIEQYKPALEELAKTENPFYRFFAIDYLATGEGRSFWLMICRNYQSVDDRDRQFERFAKFVPDDYYLRIAEELTEREFLDKYTRFVPYFVAEMMQKKDQPAFTWQTHLHFNYS
jgi:hypothetical protein